MGQVMLADNYLVLHLDVCRIAQYFNYTAFRISSVGSKVADLNYDSFTVPGAAGIFFMNQDVEQKTLILRDHQTCLSAGFIGAD